MVDFGNIQADDEPANPSAVDPIKLFSSLPISDPNINDLWLAQGDALRAWHENRDEHDVVINLNTGAGKTLVGLLAAQSLANETNGAIVYLCASLQLVEQTVSKADDYGLEVSSYRDGSMSNRLFSRREAPCITTYQALFNGLASDRWDDVEGIVFDDSHTVQNILRSQFTLTLDRDDFPSTYEEIGNAFDRYLQQVDSNIGFRETVKLGEHDQYFIPPYLIREYLGRIRDRLIDEGVSEQQVTKFSWAHVKDKLELCACFFSGQKVEFTPPVLPVSELPEFGDDVRRLYLSATLSADDAFVRTFGRQPDQSISPDSPAGKCERLILAPRFVEGVSDEFEATKKIIRDHKAVLVVPSYRRARRWDEIVTLEDADDVSKFRETEEPEILRLVGRFDGVDLPGDACRVMVIDGLPSGVGSLEKYFWQDLQMGFRLQSTVASRIIQAFGRISRGTSDYGVAIVTGRQLLSWLERPENQAVLPDFLQSQIELGIQLSESDEVQQSDLGDAVEQCLTRDPAWVDFYQRNIDENESLTPATTETSIEIRAAEKEVGFGSALWRRDFESAASALDAGEELFFEVNTGLGAWYLLWRGYVSDLAGEEENAHDFYQRAAKSHTKIRPPRIGQEEEESYNPQVNALNSLLYDREIDEVLDELDRDLNALLTGGSPNQVEESVKNLGMYLGLHSTRPDNNKGTGPDVLWQRQGVAWAMEVKSRKDESSTYWKDDVEQLRDHVSWVRQNTDAETIDPRFVGPAVECDERANPDEDMRIIELEEFRSLASTLRSTIEDVMGSALTITLRQKLQEEWQEEDFVWEQLRTAIKTHALRTE